VRDLGQRGNVADVQLRVADRLGIECLGVWRDGGAERAGVIGIDERDADAELVERRRELRVRAAVERPRRDDVMAVPAQREERQHLRRHAGRRRQRRAPAFERRHALLQRGDRGIRDPRVDVAERLQVEEARRVIGAVEHERCRLVDRHRAGAGRRIRNLARVQAQRVEAELAISH
jgi:hypothetical protein